MVNFMCQVDWAMGCPDIWLNIVRGVSMTVFLDEISIYTRRPWKAGGPPRCGGPHPICDGLNRTKRRKKGGFSLPDCLSWNTVLLLWDQDCHLLLWVLGPLDLDWKYAVFPGCPVCRWQIGGRLSLHNPVSQFLILYINI